MSSTKRMPPNTPLGLSARLATIRNTVLFFLFLPSTLVRTTLTYYTSPRLSWQSLPTCLLMATLKLFCWAAYTFTLPGIHPKEWEVCKAISPNGKRAREGMEAVKVILQPVKEEMRRGKVMDVKEVKAVERPGWILDRKDKGRGTAKAGEGEKVILYLHSGAYIFGHPLENAFAWSMSKELGLRVLAVNYRKTLDAATAHPAPLLDALAGYLYLINDLSFESSNIILMGDSAGGHLSLMLARYIHSIDQPLPGRLALCSPWCDFTAHNGKTNFPSQRDNYQYDFIPSLGDLAVISGMRYYDEKMMTDVYFSPALSVPKDWEWMKEAGIKVYIMRGTKELLADEIAALVKTMKSAGVNVKLRDDVDGVHVGPTMRFKGSKSWHLWLSDVKEFVA